MHVIAKSTLEAFAEDHPDALDELLEWHSTIERNSPANFAEVKALYSDADRVGRFVVFNICHNDYRLIVNFHHNRNKAYIHEVLTHKEYDRGLWKD